MLINRDAATVMENFKNSVLKLTDDISKNSKWIEENDPDPVTTNNYMVDRKIREWFINGGNLGY